MPPLIRPTPAPSAAATTLTSRRAALAGLGAALLARPARAAGVPDPKCTLAKAPSGLQWCETKEGAGAEPSPGAPVRAHYTGRLNTGVVFDSSYERGEERAGDKGRGASLSSPAVPRPLPLPLLPRPPAHF